MATKQAEGGRQQDDTYTPKQPFRTGLAHKGRAIVGPNFKFPKQYKRMLALMPKDGVTRAVKDGDKTIQLTSAGRSELKQMMIHTVAREVLERLTPPKGRKGKSDDEQPQQQ